MLPPHHGSGSCVAPGPLETFFEAAQRVANVGEQDESLVATRLVRCGALLAMAGGFGSLNPVPHATHLRVEVVAQSLGLEDAINRDLRGRGAGSGLEVTVASPSQRWMMPFVRWMSWIRR